jgi:hypothetical protein
MSNFGTNPDPTPYGEKPGSKKGCCVSLRILQITVILSNLRVGPWYAGSKRYCADAAVTGKVTIKKECEDIAAFFKEQGLPAGIPINCNNIYERQTFYQGDLVVDNKIDILDSVAISCGPCDPRNLSECNCESETEAFAPFTSEVCTFACDDGWGENVLKDLGGELNGKLLNLKVGGCSCNGCESCEKFGQLPKVPGKTWLDIPSFGEFVADKLWASWLPRGLRKRIKDMFDHEPNLCR